MPVTLMFITVFYCLVGIRNNLSPYSGKSLSKIALKFKIHLRAHRVKTLESFNDI